MNLLHQSKWIVLTVIPVSVCLVNLHQACLAAVLCATPQITAWNHRRSAWSQLENCNVLGHSVCHYYKAKTHDEFLQK
jgi:hypothetical protein